MKKMLWMAGNSAGLFESLASRFQLGHITADKRGNKDFPKSLRQLLLSAHVVRNWSIIFEVMNYGSIFNKN